MKKTSQVMLFMLGVSCCLITCGQDQDEAGLVDRDKSADIIVPEVETISAEAAIPVATLTPEPAVMPARSWLEDFESSVAKLGAMNRSRVFRRTREGARHGYFNLVLKAPLEGRETGRFVGGDIVSMVLPPPRRDIYKVSIKTWLKELDQGRLILRASFFRVDHSADQGRGEVVRLKTINLENIPEVEDGWTRHEFMRSLTLDGIGQDVDHMTIYAALDSGDDSLPAGGLVYFDDVEFSFSGRRFDPNIFRMNFDHELSMPTYLEISRFFSRSHEEVVSGDASLLLKTPLADGINSTVMGGNIARVKIPPGALGYRISMKTWLKELENGSLGMNAALRSDEKKRTISTGLDTIHASEEGWTRHEYERIHRGLDIEELVLKVSVAFQRDTVDPVMGELYIDDVEVRFFGEEPDPNRLRMNYEFQPLLPQYLGQSGIFSQSRDQAASGDFSLLLKSPLADESTDSIVGGDIARMKIPPEKAGFRVSMKTWLKEIGKGRLTLQASLLGQDGDLVGEIALGEVKEAEAGWRRHQFERFFDLGGHDASTIHVRAGLESPSSSPTVGMVYIDDFELEFLDEKVDDPGQFRMDFDDGSSLPEYLERSGVFSRTRDEASSGDASLRLGFPPPQGSTESVAGDDIARVGIPPGTEVFTLSMKTWLKGTGSDRLRLRADLLDKAGNRTREIPLADLEGPEDGWTEHHFEQPLPDIGADVAMMAVHAAGESVLPNSGRGMIYLDDVELMFHGPSPIPISLKIQSERNTYRQFNYDTNIYLSYDLRHSDVFLRTRDEASSGDYSLLLKASPEDESSPRIVGGEIARIDFPQDVQMYYKISLKTWLRDLDSGALVLREQFFDKDGDVIMEVPLDHISRLEQGWTEHRYQRNIFRFDLFESARSLALYAALDSQTASPVKGAVYIDDVEILLP